MTLDEIKRQVFIDSEEVCGNTMIDTYSAQEYVEQAYNKAIDDFAEWLVEHKIVDEDSMPEIIIDFNEEQLKAGD